MSWGTATVRRQKCQYGVLIRKNPASPTVWACPIRCLPTAEPSGVVVVCCLNADQIFKCVPAFLKANYGDWIKKLTRE